MHTAHGTNENFRKGFIKVVATVGPISRQKDGQPGSATSVGKGPDVWKDWRHSGTARVCRSTGPLEWSGEPGDRARPP